MSLTLTSKVAFPGPSEMHALTREYDWAPSSIGRQSNGRNASKRRFE